MSSFSFPCRQMVLRPATLATLTGLAMFLAAATLVLAAETRGPGDGDNPAAKDATPPVPARSDEAGPADDQGPRPGPPRDGDRRGPRPPRPEGQPGEPDWRQPGPPPGDDRFPREPNIGPGPDGPPRRPGPFGPGQPPGPQPGGPRPGWDGMGPPDPEMTKLFQTENELDRRTRELADAYPAAPQDQQAKLKQDLTDLVTKHFETRQQRRALELKRFEEELKRLRDAMDRREKDRQQLIDKRVTELLGVENEAGF